MTLLEVFGWVAMGWVGFGIFILAFGPALIAWLEDRF